MQDQFLMQFATTEGYASALRGNGESMQDILVRLQNASQYLYSGGLGGAFLADLQSRTQWMVDQLRQIADETSEAGRDLQTVVEWARRVDEECRSGFEQSNAMVDDPYDFFDWVKDGYKFVDEFHPLREGIVKNINNWLLNNDPDQNLNGCISCTTVAIVRLDRHFSSEKAC